MPPFMPMMSQGPRGPRSRHNGPHKMAHQWGPHPMASSAPNQVFVLASLFPYWNFSDHRFWYQGITLKGVSYYNLPQRRYIMAMIGSWNFWK
jgi:hypothetical protein